MIAEDDRVWNYLSSDSSYIENILKHIRMLLANNVYDKDISAGA